MLSKCGHCTGQAFYSRSISSSVILIFSKTFSTYVTSQVGIKSAQVCIFVSCDHCNSGCESVFILISSIKNKMHAVCYPCRLPSKIENVNVHMHTSFIVRSVVCDPQLLDFMIRSLYGKVKIYLIFKVRSYFRHRWIYVNDRYLQKIPQGNKIILL